MARQPSSVAGGWGARWHADRGQAAVELIATLPFVALAAAVLWQAVLAGQSASLAGSAARAAARAHAVGSDAQAAARRLLPARLRAGATVHTATDGTVVVRVPVPLVGGSGRLTTVGERAQFAPQGR